MGEGLCRGLLPHESLRYPGVDAEEDDEHSLQGVHDKHEIKGLLVGDTIEDEHRLDGEMPGACTVGGGHDDGDGAHDERDKGAGEPEVGGGVEAEEGEVVVDEVTAPDGEGVEDEEGLVAHAAQRHHSLPDASEGGAYLIIYAEAAQQEMEEQ